MLDNEQWNILTKLFPIQELKLEKRMATPTKYGTHNNYNVRLRINGVDYKTVFHDSIYNYKKNTRSSNIDILACIFGDKKCADSVKDLQEFCEMFGYNIEELRKAQRVYRGCKAAQQYFNRVLTPDDLEKLSELLNEWGY